MSGSTDRRSAERSRAGKRPHSERAAAKDREKDRAEDRVSPDRIARVRRFNRFYTRQLGVLRKTYLGSPYSLAEARVLYEIFKGGAPTATDIGRALDLDAGYLSRTLHSFEKRGLIARKASANDARQSHLALTARGRKAFVPLDRRSQDATAEMLGRLSPADEERLIAAMATIEELLDAAPPENSPPCAREAVARIRLLLVDPKARGLGLGRHLTDECIRFACDAGYRKMTLWTHSVLTAARHIYQQAGFKLMRSEQHESWGRPVVSEHWDLEL